MRPHVRDDEWLDLIGGEGAAGARAHLAECEPCRTMLGDVREGWQLARDADVPEPSPLYWESFRRGVGRRIAEEDRPAHRGLWVTFGSALAGLAAVALFAVLTGHGGFGQGRPAPTVAAVLPAWSPLPPADADEGLAVLAGIDSSDLSRATCSDVALCLADSSDEEQARITRALKEELKGRPL